MYLNDNFILFQTTLAEEKEKEHRDLIQCQK